jgi:membrane-associated phospholipid phosphatase
MRAFLRTEYLPALLCAALTLAAGCATDPDRLSAGQVFDKTYNNLWNYMPDRIISDANVTFTRSDNIIALLLAGGASIAMHNTDADSDIADSFDRRVFNDFTEESLDYIGSPGTHFAAAGLWYMWSLGGHDQFNQNRAWTMLSALSVNGLVTLGLKGIVYNDTPNGKNLAWPSGHTSSSFTVAAVLDEFYGPKVGIPAYIVATLVGLRMMDTGDHWASDVVFGATLGWVVGHTIAGKHKQLEIAGFKILPYLANHEGPVIGVNLVKRF